MAGEKDKQLRKPVAQEARRKHPLLLSLPLKKHQSVQAMFHLISVVMLLLVGSHPKSRLEIPPENQAGISLVSQAGNSIVSQVGISLVSQPESRHLPRLGMVTESQPVINGFLLICATVVRILLWSLGFTFSPVLYNHGEPCQYGRGESAVAL